MEKSAASDDKQRLAVGGLSTLGELFDAYRPLLERMVEFRLDPRVRGRIDAADVLQEAYLDIARRLPDYLANPHVAPFVWMRQMTLQKLVDLQRSHFRDKRSPQRELAANAVGIEPQGTSSALATYLIAEITSPSQAAVRAEETAQLTTALQEMNEIDREVLALRHFEMLSNQQVAEVLGLTVTAASNRYVRAVTRLGEILKSYRQDRSGA
jgi:RNA polymerase sigma-70 factor (ECF subfamily)